MYTIYKITNLLTGQVYIGCTSRGIRARMADHLDYYHKPTRRRGRASTIQRALRMYGPHNFTVEAVERVAGLKEAQERERYWIRYYQSRTRAIGYNRAPGGEGLI